MGLFNKLFGSKEPAPQVQIHPEDTSLVREDDIRWWKSLSLDDCKAFEKQDNLFKVVALRDYIENLGLSEKEASKKVRKSFLFYYGHLSERDHEPFGFNGEDAKLPYVLKDRANRAISQIIKKMSREEIEAASSMNAIMRRILRSGF